MYSGNLQTAKAYVNIKCYGATVSPPSVDFQYWFFYPAKGALNAKANFLSKIGEETNNTTHIFKLSPYGIREGCWEHLTVRVDANNLSKITGLYFGNKKIVSNFLKEVKTENGHPKLFVSRNRHTFHLTAGDNVTDVLKDVVNIVEAHASVEVSFLNHCIFEGQKIDFSNKIEIINAVDMTNNSELYTMKPPLWLNFKGQWGETKEHKLDLKKLFIPIEGILGKLPGGLSEGIKKLITNAILEIEKVTQGSVGPKDNSEFILNEFI